MAAAETIFRPSLARVKAGGVSDDCCHPLREELRPALSSAVGRCQYRRDVSPMPEHLFSLNYMSVYAFITHPPCVVLGYFPSVFSWKFAFLLSRNGVRERRGGYGLFIASSDLRPIFPRLFRRN
ncbi:hypothetical protein AVEN_251471-1 [Araneus ventricosus]|uniref:Uncharacterized protein n=1 Tax=Araneus ventricosus TaxID=182803 RepID=A0A4Y2PNR2_ARAVE|nr:hypothetical protein AVEN_251471-1 [Araneus ventricosus]